MTRPRQDINTLSNFGDVVTTHTAIELDVDFEQRILKGTIELSLLSLTQDLQEIILDTSYIQVHSASVNGFSIPWQLQPRTEPNGSPLCLQLEQVVSKGDRFTVKVSKELAER